MSNNIYNLPDDAWYYILYLLDDHDMLTCRAACKFFLCTLNNRLRRKYEHDIVELLQSFRMKCEKVPMKYILMKASYFHGRQPVYKCSRCKRDTSALGECKSCQPMKHAISYSRILKRIALGPSLLLFGMCLVGWYIRPPVTLRSRRLVF